MTLYITSQQLIFPSTTKASIAFCLQQQSGSSQELWERVGVTSRAGHPELLQAAQSRRRIKPEAIIDCPREWRGTFLQHYNCSSHNTRICLNTTAKGRTR